MTVPTGQWGDLSQRMLTGGIAGVVGLGLLWVGGIPFHFFAALVAGIIVWEVVRMIGGGTMAVPLGAFSGIVLLVLAYLPATFGIAGIFLTALAGIALLGQNRITFALFAIGVLIGTFGLVLLRDNYGFAWTAWLALCVITSDVLGYFAGRKIGGPKFWPKISPKKTWSGTVAGWLGAAIVGLVMMWMGFAGTQIIVVSVVVAFAGQLGDIAQSALKRRMNVKDSSAILPGHGGVFDRFDAMLGASLFFFLIRQFMTFPPGLG